MRQTRHLAALAISLALLGACTSLHHSPHAPPVPANPVPVSSTVSFDQTAAQLEAAIRSRGFTVFAEVDHAAGAESAGLSLAPSRLFIFGNPQGGTPLMQANPALGLDLPLKALVYEEDGEVNVLVTDIRTVTAAAGVTEPEALIARIEGALAAIAAEATGTE